MEEIVLGGEGKVGVRMKAELWKVNGGGSKAELGLGYHVFSLSYFIILSTDFDR